MSREQLRPQELVQNYSQLKKNLQANPSTPISPYPLWEEEIEEVALLRNPEQRVLVRQVDPDVDAVMEEEEMAASVRQFDDPAVAIMLLVGHKKLETARQITDYINRFSPNDEQIIARKTTLKHLNRLADAGMLQRDVKGEPGQRPGYHFEVLACHGLYLSQAGFLANLSTHYHQTLRSIFGEAEPPRGEDRYRDDTLTHTLDRIRIIRLLNDGRRENGAHQRLPMTAAFVADKLGISQQRAAHHLHSLEQAGALEVDSINSGEGSYQKYQRDSSVSLGRTSSELQRLLLEFADGYPDGIDTHQATEFFLSQQSNEESELSPDRWRQAYDKVRKCMYHLSATGVFVPQVPNVYDSKMTLTFRPQSKQLQLIRDTVISLFDVRKDDHKTEAEGKRLGERIVSSDKFGVLAEKLLRENKGYRERRTDRVKSPEVVLFDAREQRS